MRLAASVVVLAAVLLAGCGSDETETVTQTDTETVSETQSTTQASTETSADARHLSAFMSPSENIGCHLTAESVRCDIRKRSWSPPPQPSSCELDFGQGIELVAGGSARFVCAGDTTLGAGEVLDYGEAAAAGSLRCESEQAGITCRDSESGRGFFLARERYQIF